MYERFTDRARKIMQLANQEAQRFNHEYIGTEHIFLGMIKEGSGVAANVLTNLNVDLRKARLGVEALVQSGPEMITIGKLPQTPRAKKVIEYAMEEQHGLSHSFLGSEHLLLGLLRENEGVAAQVLMNLGLKLDAVRDEVMNLLGFGIESPGQIRKIKKRRAHRLKNRKKSKNTLPIVERYSVDLVRQQLAFPRHIELNESVIRKMLISLSRTTVNNLFLAGDMYSCEEYVRHVASLLATKQMPSPLARHAMFELNKSGKTEKFHEVCMESCKLGNVILTTDLFAGPVNTKDRLVALLDQNQYWFSQPAVKFILCGSISDWQEIRADWPRVADSFSMVKAQQPAGSALRSVVEFERIQLECAHCLKFEDDAVDAAIQSATLGREKTDFPVYVKAIEILDFAAARSRLFGSPPKDVEQQKTHDELLSWFFQMHQATKSGSYELVSELDGKIKNAQTEYLKSRASGKLPVIGKSEIVAAMAELDDEAN